LEQPTGDGNFVTAASAYYEYKKILVLRNIGRRYCLIDLDGGRTSHFPIPIDQTGTNNNDEANNDDTADSENEFGWVTYFYRITGLSSGSKAAWW
jgi:hypothetical protein